MDFGEEKPLSEQLDEAEQRLSTYRSGPQGAAVKLALPSLSDITVTADELLQMFAKLPLPQRMRAAAEVLEEALEVALTKQPCGGTDFRRHAERLREWADQWEREDAQTAGREQAVEELARELWQVLGGAATQQQVTDFYRDIARKLIDAGWTKVTHDE